MANLGIIFLLIFLVCILVKTMNEENNRIRNIHFYYIISILGAIIVFLVTWKFGNNSSLVSYVSFASTLASLILAILAIIYSMISSSSFNKSVFKISDVSDNLSQKSIKLNEASEQIVNSISIIENKMEEIVLSVCEIKGVQSELLEQKTDVDLKLINKEGSKSIDVEKLVSSLMENSSISGLIALYIMKVSKNKSIKKFNLRSLSDKLIYLKYDYVYGFLVAMSSIGVINFRNFKKDEIGVTHVNKYIDEKILNILKGRLEKFEEENSKVETVLGETDKIDKFFNECC